MDCSHVRSRVSFTKEKLFYDLLFTDMATVDESGKNCVQLAQVLRLPSGTLSCGTSFKPEFIFLH